MFTCNLTCKENVVDLHVLGNYLSKFQKYERVDSIHTQNLIYIVLRKRKNIGCNNL